MTMRSPLNTELSALLARTQASGLSLGNLSLAGIGGFQGADALGLGSAGNLSSLLPALLLQQQVEERQKYMLAQQLASLGGLSSLSIPPPPSDNLSMLLQQKQQLQALQALGASSSFDGLAALRACAAPSDLGFMGNTQSQLDALAKILQAQQQQPVSSAGSGLVGPLQAATMGLPSERKRKGRTGTFPQKLHQILQELERQEGGVEIASFLPHGRAFAIHKPREFVKHIMPKYFRMSRFSSFQRQLNLYDFQRITEGPDKGAYYHELFVKGRPILSTMMKRNKIKGVKIADEHSHDGDEDDHEENASRR